MVEFTNYIGTAAGVCTAISMLPQLFKIIKEKKAQDISYFMLGILLTGLGCWTWYGILKEDIPIIATNSFSVLVNLVTMGCTIRYKH